MNLSLFYAKLYLDYKQGVIYMCFFRKKKKQQQTNAVEQKEVKVQAESKEEKAPVVEEKAPVAEQPKATPAKAETAPEKEVVEASAEKKTAPKKAEPKAAADNAKKARFVYRKTDKGNYVYKLYSSNHRVIAIGGEPYSSLASMKTGIQSIIKNAADAPVEDQTLKKVVEQKCPKWEVYLDAKGEYRFRLKASNGNIVCITNDGYLSKPACKNGMQAIAKAAVNAEIVQEEEE